MDMISIDTWEPAAGELIEFVPSAATLASRASASTSTAPPSSIQAGHIRTAMERRERGLDWSPWLAFSVHMPTRLDREALRGAVTDFITRHTTLLSWFEGDVDNLERRVLPAEAVTLETTSHGYAGSAEAVRTAVRRLLDEGTGPLSWPCFVVGAIDHDAGPDAPHDGEPRAPHGGEPRAPHDGEPRGFTLYYGVDHSHTDGVSVMLAVQDFHELYQRRLAGAAEPLEPVGSYIDFSVAERELEEQLTLESPAVAVWLQALSEVGFKFPSFALPLGLEPGETAPSRRTIFELADTGETLGAFEQVVRAAGGGMSAGLFAALATLDAELAGRDRYVALGAVSTRLDPAYARAQGWFINLVPVSANLAEAQSFDARVAALQASLKRAKPAVPVPARKIFDTVAAALPGGGGISPTVVPPMVSCIDTRRFPIVYGPALGYRTALAGPGSTGDVSLWIHRLHNRCYIGVSYPDTAVAHESVSTYLDALRELIERIGQPARA